MAKKYLLTKKGYDELVEKLEHAQTVLRREASERIAEARSYGDLSENAEYDAAKEAQALLEVEITNMQTQVENAEIIAENVGMNVVNVGSTVKIFDLDMNEEAVYKIVGHTEASVLENKISNDSPLALAMIGAKAGQTVTVKTPNFSYEVKIVEII